MGEISLIRKMIETVFSLQVVLFSRNSPFKRSKRTSQIPSSKKSTQANYESENGENDVENGGKK
jgi:hypothetical protein